jgi:hypothetical protein
VAYYPSLQASSEFSVVIAGLDPAIHPLRKAIPTAIISVMNVRYTRMMDRRVRPGNDELLGFVDRGAD